MGGGGSAATYKDGYPSTIKNIQSIPIDFLEKCKELLGDKASSEQCKVLTSKIIPSTLYGICAIELPNSVENKFDTFFNWTRAYFLFCIGCINADSTKITILCLYGQSQKHTELWYGNRTDYEILKKISKGFDELINRFIGQQLTVRFVDNESIVEGNENVVLPIVSVPHADQYDKYKDMSLPIFMLGSRTTTVGGPITRAQRLDQEGGTIITSLTPGYHGKEEAQPLSNYRYIRFLAIIGKDGIETVKREYDINNRIYVANGYNIPSSTVETFCPHKTSGGDITSTIIIILLVVLAFTLCIYCYYSDNRYNKPKMNTSNESADDLT